MLSPELTEQENENRWLILRAKVEDERIKAAFRLLRDNGIEPILIKGWAVAREYPERHRRVSSDIDLAVSPGRYKEGLELISNVEYGKLNIDLHCGLRHLDTLEWDKLFQNSRLELIDDVNIRILCPEDHLRVLCVHWLTDGGAYKERLLDIFYLLQNNSKNFDWEKCFQPLDENRRDWIKKTVTLVHRYHNLSDLSLPFAIESDSIPGWFMNALEKEWASETRLNAIHAVLGNRKEFRRQLKLRISPNSIQSTVLMEGKFDDSSRLYYQAGSILLRLKPSIRKTLRLLKNKIFGRFR
jgi:hypothetical protein